MKLKKVLAVGLAAGMMLSTSVFADGEAAAINQDAPNTEVTEETLNVALPSEPSTIWQGGTGKTENEASIISGAIFDTLLRQDQNTGELLPNLATEWEWVDDTHCKFTLRDDVTMTDGTPLVAEDVVYTIGVHAEKSANTDYGRYFDAATTTADDEHTVTIGFTTKAPDLLTMMSWTAMGIVSEDEVEALGGIEAAASKPSMGCGKYIFKEWNSGQSVLLERNDSYWNPEWKGYFKEIRVTFVNDAASRVMAVEAGDTDVAYELPVNQAATYVGNDRLSTYLYTFGQVSHLFFNMGDKANSTKDLKVRQAIDLALNYDAVAAVGTGGYGPAALGYFDSTSAYYTETYTAEERAQDIEKAKELLAEAGYESGLEISTIALQNEVNVLTVVQACLAQAGITLNINTVDTAQYVEMAFGGDYDIIMVGEYTAARFPTLFTFFQKGPIESGFVIGGDKYTTDELDAAIQEAIEEADEAKAKEELSAIEQTFKADVLVVNLYPQMQSMVTGSALKGATTRERSYVDITNFYR